MAKNDRFIKTYSQGAMNIFEIWVDKETGVNYIYREKRIFRRINATFRSRW